MPTAKPILVIGSLNMDLVARCEHLPRTGQTVFGTEFFTAAGGKGANQAVAAARLGARVAMAGCVGDDQFGRDLVAGLRRDGVLMRCRADGGSADRHRADHHRCAGRQYDRGDLGRQRCLRHGIGGSCAGRCGAPGILLLQHEIPEEVNAHAIRRRMRRDGSSCSIRRRRVFVTPDASATDRRHRAERDRGGRADRQQRSARRRRGICWRRARAAH